MFLRYSSSWLCLLLLRAVVDYDVVFCSYLALCLTWVVLDSIQDVVVAAVR